MESGAKVGIGTALVLVGFSVLGVVVRIANRHTHDTIAQKQAALPSVGSQGTLAHAPVDARLCAVDPSRGGFTRYPCGKSGTAIAPSSKVRVMKATMNGTDAVCRYWVQGGPNDNASGDAPCEWFVTER